MHFLSRRKSGARLVYWIGLGGAVWVGCAILCGSALDAAGAELSDALKQFATGRYQGAIQATQAAIEAGEEGEEWRQLLLKSLLAVGEYTNALAVANEALDRYPRSIQLRLVAREVYLGNGDTARGRSMLESIYSLYQVRAWAYQDPPGLVALGRSALLLGNDPRRVLEQFFDRARKDKPDSREVYLASGDLALSKGDFALAAKTFREGLKHYPEDADFHYGLARAFESGDRSQMIRALYAALSINTNHVPSYLVLADHLIDGEQYEAAAHTLEKALAVNPWQPEAWAYRAVMEHLESSAKGEARSREEALRFWADNPLVDHLIGKKLSQKYRFAEGAAYQRQALRFDRGFLAAKIQLAQDLLRLGEESAGWRLAGEVYQQDAYNVTAFNLVTLQETLEKFQTLTNEHFVVRMSRHEAGVYGGEVLALLEKAHQTLCAKYGLELTDPVTVEIFPEQKDFGVRTFGIPDNPGFLGVCFGSVITANSPASQAGHPSNWKAVLWHEFCHVVTLHLTKNKMPRWLSEGISVHEELEANPIWGQSMNPRYREMILGEDLTPVGGLSAAFLAPKSDFHLQFAYYESALVVEFLVDRYGLKKLVGVLHRLGEGMGINEALSQECAPLDTLQDEFAAFARKRAEAFAPGLDWKRPEPDDPTLEEEGWETRPSTNYFVLLRQARKLMRDKRWAEAKVPLESLVKLYPDQRGADNAYGMLAAVHRELKEGEAERDALRRLAARDADAVDAFLRLMTFAEKEGRWPEVAENAERYLAVNPLVAPPYQALGRASESLDRAEDAIRSYRTLLLLDAPDPADTHFRLARLLHVRKDESARRHLLQALEEAPRFRDAHRLLLEMDREKTGSERSSAIR